jgi:membrane fusion protein, heavy metal efflux system
VATIGSPLTGKVWRIEKDLGQPVKKGDVLALVDAAEVGRAKNDFLKALAQLNLKRQTLERIKGLVPQGVVSESRLQEIQTEEREAHIQVVSTQQVLVNLGLPIRSDDATGLAPEEIARRVQFLGLPPEVVKTLEGDTTTANLIPIKAALDGVVVFRKGVAGDLVDPAKTLFVVADPRRMLVTLHVRLEDAKALAEGQTVRFRPEGAKEEVTGVIREKGISTSVDEKTRTVQVRADLSNPSGKVRSNTFGAGRIVLRREANAVVVPNESVHWDGSCHIVFVQDKKFHSTGGLKVFHVRSVRPGGRDEKQTEIIAGLLPGENVVTQGSAILRAELLKNNLGEG